MQSQPGAINIALCYRLQKLLGEGTFGRVYSAQIKDVPEPGKVAVKRVAWDHRDGVPRTTLREAAYLQQLRHPNIIRLRHVCIFSNAIDLVMDLCETTLHVLIRNMRTLLQKDDLCWDKYAEMALPIMDGLASAAAFCHANGVMHRDIKPQNVLLKDGLVVKLCDFGAATGTDTAHVAHLTENTTLWYRAPEQLIGESPDTPAVDAWSLGAIMLEMMWLYPVLPGKHEDHQLALVLDFAGPPTPESWPRGAQVLAERARKGRKLPKTEPRDRIVVNALFDEAAEVAESLLIPNPDTRMTCAQAAIMLHDILAKNNNVQKQS